MVDVGTSVTTEECLRHRDTPRTTHLRLSVTTVLDGGGQTSDQTDIIGLLCQPLVSGGGDFIIHLG